MNFIDIIASIKDVSGLVIMAGLFVYIFIKDRQKADKKDDELREEKKNTNAVLSELSASNRNIAESLNLLKTSIDNNTNEFSKHNERAIDQYNSMNEKLIMITEHITRKE